MKNNSWLFLIFLGAALMSSCRKQGFTTSPSATISIADSIRFDTLFTNTGSITKNYTIINTNDQKLRLNSIRLMGGSQSAYKININGSPTALLENIELDAGDSIYVFVSVTINPNDERTPFLIRDSIEVIYNGNQQYTQLEAYGQNAHFLRNHMISDNTIWENDLPYVISGGLYVDAGAVLTIQEGCRIYLHANAPILVDGSLVISGTDSSRVSFQGDRLDRGYRNLPASWPGIVFSETSQGNTIVYTTFKNAYQAITAIGTTSDGHPKLRLAQCILDNVYDTGIYGIGSTIEAVNCLISNCGANIKIVAGGHYSFTHCTISSFNNVYFNHIRPLISISDSDEQVSGQPTAVTFRNTIIWADGSAIDNDIITEKKGNGPFNILFDHTLYGTQTQALSATEINCIVNQTPLFDSIDASRRIFDFRLKAASPAIGAGTPTDIETDLLNKPRTGQPDLGCYTRS